MNNDHLEVSWKECLKMVLESLGLKLELHELEFPSLQVKTMWWYVRALTPCSSEVIVDSRDHAILFKERSDGSKIWYPIFNAYGNSEEEACKNYLMHISGNDLVFYNGEDLSLLESKRKTVIQVPSLDTSSPESLRIDLDLLGLRKEQETQKRDCQELENLI